MSDETLGQDASHRRKAAERAVAESIHWIRAYIPDYGPSKKYAMLVDHARIIRPKIRSCEKDHSHQKETREVMIGVSGVSSVYVGRGVAPPVGRDRARRPSKGVGRPMVYGLRRLELEMDTEHQNAWKVSASEPTLSAERANAADIRW